MNKMPASHEAQALTSELLVAYGLLRLESYAVDGMTCPPSKK
jgi:hypothetical protein